MEKLDYLEKLHDLAYAANQADVAELRADWQTPDQVSTHVNALMALVRDVIGNGTAMDLFLDCFGDFDSFRINYAKLIEESDAA